ncbi:MAG: hypothetical protein J07HQW1_01106 [Haloquadratum walsbyi J07HQW1]|uniref:Uncharacterized protein n=1 Tax=Haloquadratum walsbyi J07HQW1 TaxID=1238424 RepID=U1MMS5_9EURY|nr:MAG: hypothetical protein J07HQW1_01106 [Haloquadratum walsbyi J07HQW1]
MFTISITLTNHIDVGSGVDMSYDCDRDCDCNHDYDSNYDSIHLMDSSVYSITLKSEIIDKYMHMPMMLNKSII